MIIGYKQCDCSVQFQLFIYIYINKPANRSSLNLVGVLHSMRLHVVISSLRNGTTSHDDLVKLKLRHTLSCHH